MKTPLLTLLATLTLVASLAAHSSVQKEAGPHGGRVLTKVEPHAEFFVTTDRKVQITFLGEDGKPIAPAAQTVTVTAGERSAPVKLSFVRSGDSLLSEQTLPDGNNFPTVVQIKVTPDAKTVVEKFTLNLSVCPGCKLAEYACTCDHAH